MKFLKFIALAAIYIAISIAISFAAIFVLALIGGVIGWMPRFLDWVIPCAIVYLIFFIIDKIIEKMKAKKQALILFCIVLAANVIYLLYCIFTRTGETFAHMMDLYKIIFSISMIYSYKKEIDADKQRAEEETNEED